MEEREAPGWDAIDEALAKVYGTQEPTGAVTMSTRIVFVRIALVLTCIRGLADPAIADVDDSPRCPIDPCDDSEYGAEARAGVFRGIYTLAFEQSTFRAAGSKCEWWMDGDIDAVRFTLGTGRSYEGASVRVEVEGVLSAAGCYGHLGGSRRELRVSRLISVEQRSGEDWKPLRLKVPPTQTPPGPLPPQKLRP